MSIDLLPLVYWENLNDVKRRAVLSRPALSEKPNLRREVVDIIERVKRGGDAALKDFTRRFDGVCLSSIKVDEHEISEAIEKIKSEDKEAIDRAFCQLTRFHEDQKPENIYTEVSEGVRCFREYRPIESVGFYVPGGTAPLPSTVLMLGVPAMIAGCKNRVLCSPPSQDGTLDITILYAASLVGITEIYKVGGAQAVSAMAFGTETVRKVDKIFGPGNAYVTEAKMIVSNDPEGASLDLPAGPSEVLVIADKDANPRYIASDLLSQAEHGADSHVVFLTTSRDLCDSVVDSLETQLEKLPRKDLAKESLSKSIAIVVKGIEEALYISNRYAPEHLILHLKDTTDTIKKIKNAGSVFVGEWSPESMGDYASGTNHVLPTYGFARAMSGVGVEAFVKYITFQEVSKKGLLDLGPVVERLASLEGLVAHERAVSVRLSDLRKEIGR